MNAIQFVSTHRDECEASEMLEEWKKIDTFIGGRAYLDNHRGMCQVFFTEDSPIKDQDGARVVLILDSHKEDLGIK